MMKSFSPLLQRRAVALFGFRRPLGSCAEPVRVGRPEDDFSHHRPGLARLNHGSFGSCPIPVLRSQDAHRAAWLAAPDELYFSGELHEKMRVAARSTLPTFLPAAALDDISDDQVCLVENATVATVAVARHWASKIKPGDIVVYLSVVYGASENILKEHCESRGAILKKLDIPFPCRGHAEIVESIKSQLRSLPSKSVRFALIDHVSSQPALLLPAQEIIAACREYGAADLEVCLDGAHSVGSCATDVVSLGADWFLSNLHKWGFAPHCATILYARRPELMGEARHPITSWDWGKGLAVESRFTGSRDYSAMLAVPAAMEYLRAWQSPAGESAEDFCHRRVLESSEALASAWGTTEDLLPAELVATQSMVRLPRDLVVADIPGQPGKGVRSQLRAQHNVEAAIGNFGEKGSFVRLSYAVYNTEEDIRRLRDGVLDILAEQRRSAGR
eukprot:TRINITY_DN58758_c0_g1_i1.p1 TRINITY_DN58758_c0_g1~~TRINITY_DN58758_c0_g1_i1.p1  ORF type:complete len:446 (+),score=46.65 TRINITY_DN58758_c0_g1_i1:60-1397(+)